MAESGAGVPPLQIGGGAQRPSPPCPAAGNPSGWGPGPTSLPPSLPKVGPLIHTQATFSPCPPTSTVCPLSRPRFLYKNPFRIKGSASPTPTPSALHLTQPLGVRG